MKYIKLFENKFIENQLDELGIKNYTINSDLSVDVNGDVYIGGLGLYEIPIKFGKVSGNFICSNNNLKNLKNCPTEVGGDFRCNDNQLETLEGCPVEVGLSVGGIFDCSDNKLTSLNYCPSEVDSTFWCVRKWLTDLDISSNIGGILYCTENDIDPNNYNFYGEVKKIDFSYIPK